MGVMAKIRMNQNQETVLVILYCQNEFCLFDLFVLAEMRRHTMALFVPEPDNGVLTCHRSRSCQRGYQCVGGICSKYRVACILYTCVWEAHAARTLYIMTEYDSVGDISGM